MRFQDFGLAQATWPAWPSERAAALSFSVAYVAQFGARQAQALVGIPGHVKGALGGCERRPGT